MIMVYYAIAEELQKTSSAGCLRLQAAVSFARGKAMPHDKHYSTARHKAWAEKVLRRAGYLCEECRRYGRTDGNGLPVRATTAHHIKHRDEYPELQYDVNNGQALCEKCHNKAHPEKGGCGGRYWS